MHYLPWPLKYLIHLLSDDCLKMLSTANKLDLAIKYQFSKLWSIIESMKSCCHFSFNGHVVALHGCCRKGGFPLLGDRDLGSRRTPIFVTDGNGLKVLGTIRLYSLLVKNFLTSHILRKALAPWIPFLDPTTAHWEWRDGESIVVPSWLHLVMS